jgi:hypothetical protein
MVILIPRHYSRCRLSQGQSRVAAVETQGGSRGTTCGHDLLRVSRGWAFGQGPSICTTRCRSYTGLRLRKRTSGALLLSLSASATGMARENTVLHDVGSRRSQTTHYLCFVCSGRGQLASSWPRNNGKGVYPNGGSSKLCGETTHLARDCTLRKIGR